MLDAVLVTLLVVGMPALALHSSLTSATRQPRTRTQRYTRTIWQAGAILGLLVVNWIASGRSTALLGFDSPLSVAGLIGLCIAAAVLIALVVSTLLSKQASGSVAPQGALDLMPQTRSEVWLFVTFSVVAGVAWETLYRGFLLWALTPHVGSIVAIGIAAIAYGLAHGYTSLGAFAGSLAGALLFTTAYALTQSLWWLIMLHAGLPLIGMLAFRSMFREAAPIQGPTE
jgi:membrane protease YdiL (CAAX protease family)